MPNNDSVIVALDVGERRIGIATAMSSGLPSPLKTIENTQNVSKDLVKLFEELGATTVVVGLPRNLEGNDTAQTASIRAFTDELKKHITLPIHFQDEALTSKKAEQELADRGVPYNREMVDALAATYILSDFLGDHPKESMV